MDTILIEYIETKEYGKIAHFIDEKGNNIYSRILNDNDTIYYTELSNEELNKIKDEIDK